MYRLHSQRTFWVYGWVFGEGLLSIPTATQRSLRSYLLNWSLVFHNLMSIDF